MNEIDLDRSRGIQAAILTGGMSTRMGTDKALVDFEGQPLIERIFHRLSKVQGVNKVFAVGDRPEYHDRGFDVFSDAYPDTGPLGGIASAIKYADSRIVLVVATDMPFLSASLIEAMISIERQYDVLVPLRSNGRGGQRGQRSYETLHAMYSQDVLPNIELNLSNGDNRVVGFYDQVNVQTVDESWVSKFDPEFKSFINVNRLDELNDVRAHT